MWLRAAWGDHRALLGPAETQPQCARLQAVRGWGGAPGSWPWWGAHTRFWAVWGVCQAQAELVKRWKGYGRGAGSASPQPVILLKAHGLLPRLDRQTQATTLVHQIFGGYLRSRGEWGLPSAAPD